MSKRCDIYDICDQLAFPVDILDISSEVYIGTLQTEGLVRMGSAYVKV